MKLSPLRHGHAVSARGSHFVERNAAAGSRNWPAAVEDLMLEKTYTPETVEDRRYREWEEGGFFKCGQNADGNSSDETFTIVIPPPNVTGSLHMGHALNNTLQDIMVRYQRMRGLDVLW